MEPIALACEERGSGFPLVFVHGFPLHAGMWRGQVTGLAKKATCIAVDLRGHGMSADLPVEGVTMDLFADDIAKSLDEMAIERADLCALSMGGYVAFAFLRRHPGRVRSLILCDTKAEADSDEAKAGRDGTAALVRSDGMKPLWDKLRQVLFADTPSDESVALAERVILECLPETAAAAAIAMRDRPDYSDDLPSIGVPVTWIHGTEDKLMPLAAAEAAAARIPGARLVPVQSAGHLAPMEQPAAVNAAILEHLSAL